MKIHSSLRPFLFLVATLTAPAIYADDWGSPYGSNTVTIPQIFVGGYKLKSGNRQESDVVGSIMLSGLKVSITEFIGAVLTDANDGESAGLISNLEELAEETKAHSTETDSIKLKASALADKIDLVNDENGISGINPKNGVDLAKLSEAEKRVLEEIRKEIKASKEIKGRMNELEEGIKASREEIKGRLDSGKLKIPPGLISADGHPTEEGLKFIRDKTNKGTNRLGKGLMIFGLVELGADAWQIAFKKQSPGVVPLSSTIRSVKELSTHGTTPNTSPGDGQ